MSKQHKNGKRKVRRKNPPIWMWFIFIALIIVLAVVIHREVKNAGNKKDSAAGAAEEESMFPYELEKGKLEIGSLFQYSGINPDAEDENGENIAAITVTNKSEKHLKNEEITVVLSDKTKLEFEVTNVPAGKTVIAFDKNSTVYDETIECKKIKGSGEFEDKTNLMEEQISIEVNATEVTLKNTSDKELKNLVLHCHSLVDDSYFGGLTYTYPVENIPAGKSVTVDAVDCYIGETAVVGISQEDGE